MLDIIRSHGLTLKPPNIVLSSNSSLTRELALQIQRWIVDTEEGRLWAVEQRDAWEAVADRADIERLRREVDLRLFEPDREYRFGRDESELAVAPSEEEEEGLV